MLAIGFWTGYFAGILTIPTLLLIVFFFYVLVVIVEHKRTMMKIKEGSGEFAFEAKRDYEKKQNDFS